GTCQSLVNECYRREDSKRPHSTGVHWQPTERQRSPRPRSPPCVLCRAGGCRRHGGERGGERALSWRAGSQIKDIERQQLDLGGRQPPFPAWHDARAAGIDRLANGGAVAAIGPEIVSQIG